jgi:hypothetical protein
MDVMNDSMILTELPKKINKAIKHKKHKKIIYKRQRNGITPPRTHTHTHTQKKHTHIDNRNK